MNPYRDEHESTWLAIATQWLLTLCADLRQVLTDVGRLVRQVAEDWQDDAGRQWCDQAGQLERDLARQLETTGELVRRIERLASSDMPGPRLAGVDGARVAEGYGPRLPTLPPPP